MKLHIKLVGTFKRTPINSTLKKETVTLQQWMRSHLSVATRLRQRSRLDRGCASPFLLRHKFGMNFLSESSIAQLIQQAKSDREIENTDLVSPWLQLLTITAKPILYRYEFVDRQAHIQLKPDDPQLPHWETNNIAGAYKIVVEGNMYPGVSQTWLDAIWLKVKQKWKNYSNNDLLQMALSSPNNTEFSFYLPDIPFKVSVDPQELSSEIQEAVAYIRQGTISKENLSSAAAELIEEYQKDRAPAPNYFQLPEDIKLQTFTSQNQFIVGKRNRKAIEELINQAEQFLFISSYIIEDRNITELICHKAATLPQGVWILTTLNDEVIDAISAKPRRCAIDTQIENNNNSREAYRHLDEKKARCLKLLLDAGAHIRGGAFHLKTYISEKAAYLGSCNLTGGSLDFNLEGGVICKGSTIHRDLLQYFTRCWRYTTKYDVFPSTEYEKFHQRTLNNSSPTDEFYSQTLLTPRQYREDLYRELNKCSGKVEIYSRGFSPDAEILNLLETRSNRIYADGFIRNRYRITSYFRTGVHAKITLISDRVAYIGGVNFQFAPQGFKLIDLMYKTCDRIEINQIRQQLSFYK